MIWKAWVNGEIIPEEQVQLPLTDRSYLYGEGLFESMRAFEGQVPFLLEHWERLQQGLSHWDVGEVLSFQELSEGVAAILAQNDLRDAYLRLNWSRDNQDLGSFTASSKSRWILFGRPLKNNPPHIDDAGVRAMVDEGPPWLPSSQGHLKTSNYLFYLKAKEIARQAGYFEVLLLNRSKHVVEGAASNLFIWNGKKWRTPSLEEGPLAGVTRRVLMGLLQGEKQAVEEGALEMSEVEQAEEAVLCNSIMGVVPLIQIGETLIGEGKVGSQTRSLRDLYHREVQRRLGEST